MLLLRANSWLFLGMVIFVVIWMFHLDADESYSEGKKDRKEQANPVLKDLYGDPLPEGAIARMGTIRKDNAAARDYSPPGRSIALSRDGKTLITGSMDGTIGIWDAASGKPLRRLPGHGKPVIRLALCPDDKIFASVGEDGIVRLWDLDKGTEIRELKGHRSPYVCCVAFAPDGKTVASGGRDDTVRIWDVASGKEVHQFQAKQDGYATVAFSPDGKLLALGGWGPSAVHLWDLTTKQKLREFGKTRFWVHAIAFAPDSKTLAASGGDPDEPQIFLWDVATGQSVRMFERRAPTAEEDVRRIACVAFSSDGRTLASSEGGGSIYLWEVANGKRRHRLQVGNLWLPTAVTFSQDGTRLASSGGGQTALIWDLTRLGRNRGPQHASLSRDVLEGLWADLGDKDAARAYQAIWQLVAASQQTFPLLREKLQPASSISAKHIAQLLADLDSNEFSVRKKATEELEKLGDQAVPLLRMELKSELSQEARRRVEQILEKVEKEALYPSPERLRLLRALEVVEALGALREARQILETLTRGASGAFQTREAQASLDRVAKRPPVNIPYR